MGLFDRKTRNDPDWTPVTLRLLEASRPSEHGGPDNGESTFVDFLTDVIVDRAGTPYRFLLEVHPSSGEPYRVEHREKVPNSVTGSSLFTGGDKIPAGLEMSGWVDPADPAKVRIDWSGYNATPEAKAAIADAGQAEQDRLYAQHVLAKQKPKMQEQLRSSAWTATSMNAAGVTSGYVDFAQWEAEAQSNLRKTLITQEQYDEARRFTGR